jgi:hypothetical protein
MLRMANFTKLGGGAPFSSLWGVEGAAVVFGSLSHEGIIVMGHVRSAVVVAAWAVHTLAQ